MAGGTRSVSARWRGGYRAHVESGRWSFDIDEPAAVGGTDTGPMPTEVFLASIASCFTLALAASAAKRGVQLGSIEVDVRGTYAGPRFSSIELDVDVDCSADEREALIAAARRVCYVTNTIATDPSIVIRDRE